MDYMFTGTKDNGLATHLVCVDSQSKFVKVVALSGKGGSLLKYATKEVITMTQQLGYSQISLRFDAEPAMKQLAESIQASRLKMGFGTSLEPVAPEPSVHRALYRQRGTLTRCVAWAIVYLRLSDSGRDTKLRAVTLSSHGHTSMLAS